jgi:hypothetical protein
MIISHLNSLADVQGVLANIHKAHPSFSGKGPYAWASLDVTTKTPPALATSNDAVLGFTTVTGHLSAKGDAIATSLPSLLGKLIQAPASIIAGVNIDFEEKESKQSAQSADAIEWRSESGAQFFMYAANGSKVRSDADYRLAATRRLIQELELPLAVNVVPQGFALAHTAGGKVKVHAARGLDGVNPTTFSCEIQGEKIPERAQSLLTRGLATASTGKIFGFQWSLTTDRRGRSLDEVKEGGDALEFMRACGLTAVKYHVDSQMQINDLRALESVRSLFTGSDSLVVQVGAYKITDAQYVNVSVRAMADDYAVEFESNGPLSADQSLAYR